MEYINLASKELNIIDEIYRIHERALRIGYKDNLSSFEPLLEKSGSVNVHYRNLQLLAIEIYIWPLKYGI